MAITIYEFTAVTATTGEPVWPAAVETLKAGSSANHRLAASTIYAVITANLDTLIRIGTQANTPADAGGSLLDRNGTVGFHVLLNSQPYIANKTFER